MQRKPYILSSVIGLISISAAGYSGYVQIGDVRARETGANAALAPIPPGILPADTKLLVQPQPMTAVQQQALARAASHTPLEQDIFNLFYTDRVRRGASVEQTRRLEKQLSQLGWRHTPAQQNLIVRNLLDGDFRTAVDRADGLVRRQKLPEFAFAILSAMEALPEVQPQVINKLRSSPSWRRDYLSVITPNSPPALLTARIGTINALLRSPKGITRAEAAQSITSLIQSGRGRMAQQLWRQLVGDRDRRNLVYDPMFAEATVLAGTADPTIPFDWQFAQDLGFSATPSPEGTVINWDHRGAPTFMTQTVAISDDRSIALTITGNADQGDISKLLHPTLECAGRIIPFAGTAISGGARYYLPVVPKNCDIGILRIGGAVDAGTGQVMLRIKKVDLRLL
jgi:hypothetical protein